MVIVCPKCQAHLKLSQMPCRRCKATVEIDKNQVAGKAAVTCPQCHTQQPVPRLKCNKCQTVIDMSAMKPEAKPPTPAAPPAAPRATAPVAPAAPAAAAADPPGASPPPPESPSAPPAARGDVPVFKKSPALVLILCLVTFGFYMLYWCPKAAAVINAVTKGKKIGSVMAVLAGLACCWPALVKFYWRAGVALGLSRALMVLLAFFPPIAATVVQSNINKLYEGC